MKKSPFLLNDSFLLDDSLGLGKFKYHQEVASHIQRPSLFTKDGVVVALNSRGLGKMPVGIRSI